MSEKIDEKVWRERGALVTSGERWIGLVEQTVGAIGLSTEASVEAAFRTGAPLRLEEALEVAYLVIPVPDPRTGEPGGFKRFCDAASPLMTTRAAKVALRPTAVVLLKDLSDEDLAFWLNVVNVVRENIAALKRVQAGGLIQPPPRNFSPFTGGGRG